MENYAEYWIELIYGSNPSLERYWITDGAFAAACLLMGIASHRSRIIAVAATAVLFAAYVAAILPLIAWASSCYGCGAGDHESTRALVLYGQHAFLGGFLATGIAAIWIGVLLAQGVTAIMSWRSPSSPAPLPKGEG